jgi:hypothetical protein
MECLKGTFTSLAVQTSALTWPWFCTAPSSMGMLGGRGSSSATSHWGVQIQSSGSPVSCGTELFPQLLEQTDGKRAEDLLFDTPLSWQLSYWVSSEHQCNLQTAVTTQLNSGVIWEKDGGDGRVEAVVLWRWLPVPFLLLCSFLPT